MTHTDVQTMMRNRLVDTLDDAGCREFVSKLTAHIGDSEVIEEGDFDGLLVATIDDLATIKRERELEALTKPIAQTVGPDTRGSGMVLHVNDRPGRPVKDIPQA